MVSPPAILTEFCHLPSWNNLEKVSLDRLSFSLSGVWILSHYTLSFLSFSEPSDVPSRLKDPLHDTS